MPAMRRIDTGRRRACFPAVVAAAVALMVLSGCSGSIAQDLLDPVEQARSAVRSDQLVLDLLGRGQVTTGIAETVLKTMTDELLRDAVLAATREATAASVAGRDCLLQDSSCATAMEELQESAAALEEVFHQLQSSR